MSSDDNRRYPRAPIRQRVWCEGDDVTLYVRTLNASERGMFIRTSSVPDEGRRLRITFEEDGVQVVADVRVRWIRPPDDDGEPGMGVEIVEFEQGAEAYRDLIERALAGGSSPGSLAADSIDFGAPKSTGSDGEPS